MINAINANNYVNYKVRALAFRFLNEEFLFSTENICFN
jgi:hypothetical protein